MNTEKLKQLAKDLRKQPPPSPHEKLRLRRAYGGQVGGYVIAAEMLPV